MGFEILRAMKKSNRRRRYLFWGVGIAALSFSTFLSNVAFAIVLRPGDQGEAVRYLQWRLNQFDNAVFPRPENGFTNFYGPRTEAAVREFQRRYGLEEDGIAGENTLNRLADAVTSNVDAGAKGGNSSGTSFEDIRQDVSVGSLIELLERPDLTTSIRADLRALQVFLASEGLYHGEPDGIYGDLTEAAIISYVFQLRDGSGEVRDAMSLGSRGFPVAVLQRQLIDLGYLPVGTDDGDFGPQTEAAVITFQRASSLQADGVVGESTLSKLKDLRYRIFGERVGW